MLSEKRIADSDHSLNLAVGPDAGPPLVMLHGVTRRWQTFTPLLPILASRWQLFALDFRGHGESDSTHDGYHVVDYQRDVSIVIPHLPSDRFVLYGHSLGAMVAALTAARHPEKVAGLILEDPPLHTMADRLHTSVLQDFFAGIETVTRHGGTIAEMTGQLRLIEMRDPISGATSRLGDLRDSASLRFTAACLAKLDPEVLVPITSGQWLDRFDTDLVFGRIGCPTLLLQADPDNGGMLTDTDAGKIQSLVGDCTHLRLTNRPHLIHWSDTQQLLNTVTAFLESLRNEVT